jgi:hypothetical protein
MGLHDGYGVLLGTLAGYQRDDPNDFGRFMHGVLTVATPQGQFKCAVDVDTRNGAIPVQWRLQPLRGAEWVQIFSLSDGCHPLVSKPSMGAVDYIRDPRLQELIYLPDHLEEERLRFPFPPEEWPGSRLPHLMPLRRLRGSPDAVAAIPPERANIEAETTELVRVPVGRMSQIASTSLRLASVSGQVLSLRPAWNKGSSAQALLDLEAVITAPQRVVVFGAPFHVGRGVHDIHQNQGDPIGGGHDHENAIWQDGITIALRSDGTASAFMNKVQHTVRRDR